jgi:hypothetical protein
MAGLLGWDCVVDEGVDGEAKTGLGMTGLLGRDCVEDDDVDCVA